MAIKPSQTRTLKNIQLFTILASLWIGGLIGIGFLVAPTLFIYLTDKQVAGMIAGEIFKNANFLNCLMGICLLIMSNFFVKHGYRHFVLIRWLLLVLLILTGLAALIIQPWMHELREMALAGGAPVMQSPWAKEFGRLHAVSNIFFIVEIILGLWICWRSCRFTMMSETSGLMLDKGLKMPGVSSGRQD